MVFPVIVSQSFEYGKKYRYKLKNKHANSMQNSTVQEIHQIGHDRRFFQVGFLGFDEYPPERAEEPLLPDQNPLVKIMNKLESSSFNLFEEDDEILFSEKQHANATFNRKAQEKTSFLLRIPNFSRYFKQFHQKQLQDWFELSFSGEKNVKKLVCGGYHYFVLLENGDLYSCGFNRFILSFVLFPKFKNL